ncbi:uncharacterized protein [Branchiostoma lanceolatum]|uniref:uncharacterized protein n=1 Tax=Branchiostoma lanceolatum TaxID=7740 RepID=UPI0011330479
MKVALFFLAFVVVVKGQWNPLGICQYGTADACPDMNRYCCRSNTVFLGLPVCELRPHLGWPCDATLETSCECVPNTVCYKDICVLTSTLSAADLADLEGSGGNGIEGL